MALTQEQILKFKQRLIKLRHEIASSMADTAKSAIELDESKGYSQHQADEGTDDFVKNISLEVTSKERDLLRQIDRALEKIEEGTYGICDLTQEEISLKRLEAIPYATMTVKAQEQFEKGLI